MSDKVDALVIFGATGDLAKIETFPALVGLVKRGVLDVPVIGVAKSGWGLEQFRDYATASLKLNKMDPTDPAAVKMLSLLRYVDGDLGDDATYQAMSDQIGAGQQVLFYMEVPAQLFGRIAQGIATAGRARAPGSWWKSRSAPTWPPPGSSTTPCTSTSPRRPSSGSTTGWPSTRWRTCCSSGSPTR